MRYSRVRVLRENIYKYNNFLIDFRIIRRIRHSIESPDRENRP